MSNDNLRPLTVIVTEERWDVVDCATARNIWLCQTLTEIGGVSNTVTPGLYHFNAEFLDDKNLVCSLQSAE